MSIYADLEPTAAEYRAGFSVGVAYAEADRRDHVNDEQHLRDDARVPHRSRALRAFQLGIVRGYRWERSQEGSWESDCRQAASDDISRRSWIGRGSHDA